MAAQARYRSRRFVEIGVDEVPPILGVQLGGQARRADEIENITVTGRRSAESSGAFAVGAGEGCGPAVSEDVGDDNAAIAASSMRLSPTVVTPISFKSSMVR
jgi:hypothetical protein